MLSLLFNECLVCVKTGFLNIKTELVFRAVLFNSATSGWLARLAGILLLINGGNILPLMEIYKLSDLLKSHGVGTCMDLRFERQCDFGFLVRLEPTQKRHESSQAIISFLIRFKIGVPGK